MENNYVKIFLETEEKLLVCVLENLLRKKPTNEDFKKLTKFTQEFCFNKYYLAYDNLKIGEVNIKDNKFIFTPFTLGFLEPAIVNNIVTF